MFLQNFHLIDYNMLVFTIIILARRLIAAIVKEVRIQLLAFVSLYFLLIQGSQKHLMQKDCTPFFFFFILIRKFPAEKARWNRDVRKKSVCTQLRFSLMIFLFKDSSFSKTVSSDTCLKHTFKNFNGFNFSLRAFFFFAVLGFSDIFDHVLLWKIWLFSSLLLCLRRHRVGNSLSLTRSF